MFKNIFGDVFGRIAPEMVRMSYNGTLAIKVNDGYRAWNTKHNRLTNVTNFTFPVGGDFVFVVPTTKVKAGDIILHNGRPKAVVAVNNAPESVSVINYENGLMETVVPERHIFMGKTYFFGKLVSLFGASAFSGKGCKGIMKMMMLKEFMGGKGQGMDNLLPMLMLGDGMTDIFNFNEIGDLELADCDDDEDEDEITCEKKSAKKKK